MVADDAAAAAVVDIVVVLLFLLHFFQPDDPCQPFHLMQGRVRGRRRRSHCARSPQRSVTDIWLSLAMRKKCKKVFQKKG